MVWVGRDLKDHLVPAPLPERGHLPPDQVFGSSEPRFTGSMVRSVRRSGEEGFPSPGTISLLSGERINAALGFGQAELCRVCEQGGEEGSGSSLGPSLPISQVCQR